MMFRLQMMGIPISKSYTGTQEDLTHKQQAFMHFSMIEFVNEEREFQASIVGAKVERRRASSAGVVVKDPRKLKNPKKKG